MPTSLVSTGVQFPDNTIQTTAVGGYTVLLSNTFTSSGTYNKSSGTSNDTVVITVVGAGGGGSAAFYSNSTYFSGGGGGGGGGYTTVAVPYDLVPNTVAVTVGAGGVGGNTSVVHPPNSVTIAGSKGGHSLVDGFAIGIGGGGGTVSSNWFFSQPQQLGTGGTGGTAYGGLLGNSNLFSQSSFTNPSSYIAIGGAGTAAGCTTPTFAGAIIYPGDTGGGGSIRVESTNTVTFLDGGTGRAIGNGGNSRGANGSAPGGGGASNFQGTGGTGGDGRVIITVVAGSISAGEFKRRSNTYSGVTVSY